MRYVDVCFRYPYVLKYKTFPVGHPEILTEDLFGLIKCRVLPPRGLYNLVLPYRIKGKLLFPLCRTYAKPIWLWDPSINFIIWIQICV